MNVKKIRISSCKLGNNSRLDIKENELSGLMSSIKNEGLLEPIGVSKKGRKFTVIYGNRRFLACSKLGFKTIDAVIHEDMDQTDMDLKNLAENVQRRNLTLTEMGRYIMALEKQNLSQQEIAVRLGVSKEYVSIAKTAFQDIPLKHRKDVEVTFSKKVKPGKLSLAAVNVVRKAKSKHGLTPKQTDKLYDIAKQKGFSFGEVDSYVKEITKSKTKNGAEIFKDINDSKRQVNFQCKMDADQFERIYKKHVTNGPYRSMNQVFKARLNGEINFRVKIF